MPEGNFSNRVQDVIRLSKEEAIRLGHDYIGSEHLLLGILREGEGTAIRIINELNFNKLKDIKAVIKQAVRTSGATLTIGNVPYSKQAEKIIKTSYLEAKIYKSDVIGTEHLLLSILRDEDNIAAQILNQFGIEWGSCRLVLDAIINGPQQHKLPTAEPINLSSLDSLLQNLKSELQNAISKHGPIHSAHEGYAVLLEEVDELWDEVKKNQKTYNYQNMQSECLQIAAMAIRFILDVCKK